MSAPTGFTLGQLYRYAEIVDACHREAGCGWVSDVTGEPIRGTLRHIHELSDIDVSEACVRITTRTGGERFLGFEEVLNLPCFTITGR